MSKRERNFAVGAIIAAGIGYVAGILTAPKSGKETRQDIKNVALEVKKEAEAKLKVLSAELSKLIAEGTERLTVLAGKAKAELEQAIKRAQEAKQKVHEVLSAIHEGEADDADLEKAVKEANKALEHLKTFVKKPVN